MTKGPVKLRTVLRQELQNRFVKAFVEKGFASGPVPTGGKSSPDPRSIYPLGQLTRLRGNDLNIIDVQFDKYRTPKFVINFGIIPENGVYTTWGEHVERDIASAYDAPERCRLYNSTFGMRWFAIGFFSSKSRQSIERLVDKAVELSPEIDAWFSSKVVGKHMRVITGLSFAAPPGGQE